MGDLIDRYIIHEELGKGGMGIVHRATDRLSGGTVALKRVTRLDRDTSPHATPTLVHIPDAMRVALTNEFRTLSSLRHPNIITVLDYGFDAERMPYFTMEYLGGARSIIKAGSQLTQEQKIDLLMQVLHALDFLHRHRIYHRDLKPANVLVSDDGGVKVLDFGLSIIRDKRDTDPTLTVGTFAYMAPELIRSERTTPPSDLYSLGVIAYELFTGRHPFPAETVSKMLTDVMTTPLEMTDMDDVDPRLVPVLARLLSKEPRQRYQTAQDTIAAFERSMGRKQAASPPRRDEVYVHAATFVGREGELRVLEAALQAIKRGHGERWLLAGESGVGKTRLLTELRIRALVQGMLVVIGQAIEGGDPDAICRDVVRRLVLAHDPGDQAAGVLKALVPDIGSLLGREIPDAPDLPPEEAATRLQAAFAGLVTAIDRELVVLLEDVHWAGEQALGMVAHLAEQIGDRSVMLVASYQDDIASDVAERLNGLKPFKLRRLGSSAISRLARTMLGDAGKDEMLIEWLREETEGNALFLVELIRTLAESRKGSTVNRPEALEVGGVQRVIARRLDRLPEGYLPLLRAAAVAGRAVDTDVLEYINGGAVAMDSFLLAASEATVLEAVGFRWRFAHNQIRRAVLSDIPEADLAALHRSVAEALEAVYGEEDHPGQLAAHWEAAGEPVRAARSARRAAERAMETSTPREARRFTAAALRLLDGTEHEAEIAELTTLRARALVQLSEFDAAEEAFKTASRLHEKLGSANGQAHAIAGLGRVAEGHGDYAEARRHFKDAMARFKGEDRAGVALCEAALGAIAYRQSDYQAALAHNARASALYDEVLDKRGRADVMRSQGSVLHALGRTEEGGRAWRDAMVIYRMLGDRRGVATCLNNIGLAAERRGEHADARRYYERSLALKREIGDQRSIAVTLNNLSVVAMSLTQYGDAARLLAEAMGIYRRIEDKQGLADALNNLGLIEYYREEYASAEKCLIEAQAICEAIGDRWGVALAHLNMGKVERNRGKPGAAMERFRQAIEVAEAVKLRAVTLQTLVEVATLRDDDAVDLLTLAAEHDSTPGTERERAEALLAERRKVLSLPEFLRGQQRGRALTVEATLERLTD